MRNEASCQPWHHHPLLPAYPEEAVSSAKLHTPAPTSPRICKGGDLHVAQQQQIKRLTSSRIDSNHPGVKQDGHEIGRGKSDRNAPERRNRRPGTSRQRQRRGEPGGGRGEATNHEIRLSCFAAPVLGGERGRFRWRRREKGMREKEIGANAEEEEGECFGLG